MRPLDFVRIGYLTDDVELALRHTFAPSRLRLRTMPAPIPRAPPVTMATLPCRDMTVVFRGMVYQVHRYNEAQLVNLLLKHS